MSDYQAGDFVCVPDDGGFLKAFSARIKNQKALIHRVGNGSLKGYSQLVHFAKNGREIKQRDWVHNRYIMPRNGNSA